MISPDEALENLEKIRKEFKNFCDLQSNVSESDTRVKVIDKILIKVLDWKEENIIRELRANSGYIDYILAVNGRKQLVVEAKKEGIPFLFPIGNKLRTLKLNGTILTNKDIKEAIYH